MAREMKDSGVKWIGTIPTSWNIQKVKTAFYRSKEEAHIEDPVILSLARSGVKIRDISNNEGQLAESYYNYNPVVPGDLLLNPMDLYSGANCSISKVSGVISPAYINLRTRGNYCPAFYDYYFKTQYWAMALFAHGKGVSFDNRWTLSPNDLFNYYIPAPDYDEQQRIAEFLDRKCAEIDTVIEKTKTTIEEYKKLKQSVITEAVTKGIRGNRPMKDSGIEWLCDIPVEWNIKRLKTMFGFGKGLPITKENLIEAGASVISYGQIHSKINTGIDIKPDLIRFVSEDYLTTNPNSLVNLGDFIFADTSEDLDGCGNNVYVGDERQLFAGYHTITLCSYEKIDNSYLAYLFKTDCWRSQIRAKVSGVKLFSISKKILSETSVLLPEENERREIVEYLNRKCAEIDKLIEDKTHLLEEMESYKKSVIYEYVTGKKQV